MGSVHGHNGNKSAELMFEGLEVKRTVLSENAKPKVHHFLVVHLRRERNLVRFVFDAVNNVDGLSTKVRPHIGKAFAPIIDNKVI
jgi:hypothetical protein